MKAHPIIKLLFTAAVMTFVTSCGREDDSTERYLPLLPFIENHASLPVPPDYYDQSDGAPAPIQVYNPGGTQLPLIIFYHGFAASINAYNEILSALAYRGFIVAAAQHYPPGTFIGAPKTGEEAATAISVYNWLIATLPALMGSSVDVSVIGLACHSRGCKLEWLLLESGALAPGSAAALDPVDGTFEEFLGADGKEEAVLDGPSLYSAPTLILGMGRGGELNFFGTACAPDDGLYSHGNHIDFYGATQSPSWHIVCNGYGHTDMLDDAYRNGFICPGGANLSLLRDFVAEALAAFFDASLKGNPSSYDFLLEPYGGLSLTTESK